MAESSSDDLHCAPLRTRSCKAIRFYSSNNVTVRDISIINSPQCHLKFDDGRGVHVTNITISSPGDSPNTDGIHLQRTRDVEIHHSSIASGDDCVSIQTGCSNVHVHHITCGSGHRISIGGLGMDRTSACVSDIVIEHVSMLNTMYGARIKTWQIWVAAACTIKVLRINAAALILYRTNEGSVDVVLTGYLLCSFLISSAASGWNVEKIIGLSLACSNTSCSKCNGVFYFNKNLSGHTEAFHAECLQSFYMEVFE